jgi:FkbM family methyltransferase
MWKRRAKRVVRHTIGLPMISDGLRWFLRQDSVPPRLRMLAHRKLAKLALFGSRTFTYRTDGGALLELAHTGTPNYLYWLGAYEPETLRVFTQLARTASVIFDVGAAEGLYSVFAAATNPDARIHAFEPFARAAEIATRNLGLNAALCKNVAIHQMALGADDGIASLYVASEGGGNSSLNPAFRAEHSEQPTAVRRGDSFVAAHGIERVDLVKIDTESTEPAVLRGLAKCLERHHPDIVCEVLVGRTEGALMDALAPLGYGFWSITANGLERRATIVGDRSFPNYLFTTADAASLVARGLTVGRS